MRTPIPRAHVSATVAVLVGAFALAVPAQERTYAIEVNDVLCGYAEVHASEVASGGKRFTRIDHTVVASVSLLGSKVEVLVETTLHADPQTGRITYSDTRVTKGDTKDRLQVYIEGNRARFVHPLEKREKSIDLPPGTIIENPMKSPELVRDFVNRGLDSVTYSILAVQEEKVQPMEYTRAGKESVDLGGEHWDTLILDSRNKDTGAVMRIWVDVKTGMAVKLRLPGGRFFYLADPSVKKRVKMANLDSTISAKVNVVIADVRAISYMKLRAILEPVGLQLTAEDLNVPGQRFEGTVKNNRVEGVFTIQHPRYDGAGAPPFPAKPIEDETLTPFLAPENLIQSDDPVLAKQAKRITDGAKDSWDAACRLSRWVSENIDYAIPGGGNARRTYDTRSGECGAHSMLLAGFCRSVGIPARVVWGCMYVPNWGGAFAQHGWTEVHMGDAGWIPVDATAKEIDFVDSGHLRVGHFQFVNTTVNLREVVVLDYKVRTAGKAADPGAIATLAPFVGRYVHASGKRTYEVTLKENGLALVTPEKVVLGLLPPDESGRWYAKLTNRIYCTFPVDERSGVTDLTIHEILRLRRQGSDVKVKTDAPEALRPYFGVYRLAALRANFEVLFEDGSLAVYYPSRKRTIKFASTAKPGHFTSESLGHSISFEKDDKGTVTTMLLDTGDRFPRELELRDMKPDHPDVAAVKEMLLDFHRAAAEAKAERYLSHVAPDAILWGTAADERWNVAKLQAMVTPSFERGVGFTTLPTEQNVYLAAGGKFAWFDERLKSDKYGEMRGSGVVRKTDNGRWQIVQYNRAFPIPNALVPELVERIEKLHEKK